MWAVSYMFSVERFVTILLMHIALRKYDDIMSSFLVVGGVLFLILLPLLLFLLVRRSLQVFLLKR